MISSSLEEYEKKISGLGSDLDGQKKAYDEQLKGRNFCILISLPRHAFIKIRILQGYS